MNRCSTGRVPKFNDSSNRLMLRGHGANMAECEDGDVP